MNKHGLFVRLDAKTGMEPALADFLFADLRTIHRNSATPIRMLANLPSAEPIDVRAMKSRLV